jgi:prepilin peptidase CpaA
VSTYSVLLLLFPAVMTFAGAMDLLTMTIPNRISIALIAAFFVCAAFAGLTLEQVGMHLACGALILAIGMAMFAARLLGGGDAKLMAASAIWVGSDNLFMYFLVISVLGGILAIALLLYRQLPAASLRLPPWALRLHVPGSHMPYGVAIAAAALWIYPKTIWFSSFVG